MRIRNGISQYQRVCIFMSALTTVTGNISTDSYPDPDELHTTKYENLIHICKRVFVVIGIIRSDASFPP